MRKPTVYIAFDYDDLDVKESLVSQSRLPDCPFDLRDNSINRHVPAQWSNEARRLIAASDCVVVLCGTQTHQAKGVETELQIAQELGKRYFLLRGTRVGTPTKPRNARETDRIWTFRWPTLQALLENRTPPDGAAI